MARRINWDHAITDLDYDELESRLDILAEVQDARDMEQQYDTVLMDDCEIEQRIRDIENELERREQAEADEMEREYRRAVLAW